jgi:hypothetical protein
MPTLAFAAPANLRELIVLIIEIINDLIVIVAALALLYFFWGLAQFILNAGSEEGRTKGKNVMIWGIIALFVMVSVWGIIAVLNNTFFGTSGGGGSNTPAPFTNLIEV